MYVHIHSLKISFAPAIIQVFQAATVTAQSFPHTSFAFRIA